MQKQLQNNPTGGLDSAYHSQNWQGYEHHTEKGFRAECEWCCGKEWFGIPDEEEQRKRLGGALICQTCWVIKGIRAKDVQRRNAREKSRRNK